MSIAQLLEQGMKLHQAGRLEQAQQVYQQILRLEPDHADALHLLGVLAAQSGKPELALAPIQRAIAVRPNVAVYYSNLGNAYCDLGRLEEAVAQYRRAIELYPDYADGLVNLGAALRRTNRLEESETHLRRALALQPDSPTVHFHLGTTLQRLHRLDEAIGHLREALRLKPGYADARKNLGIFLRRSGRFAEAETFYREWLQERPDSAENLVNLGHTLAQVGRIDESLECFDAALRLEPEQGEAHTNRAVLWLLGGDFARGWPEYEWRWRRKNAAPPPIPRPAWDGSLLPKGTILLVVEQGVGDIFQFIRYVEQVRQRVGHVLLLCRPPLIPLLSRMPGIDRLVAEGDTVPPFDVYAMLMSLPLRLGTTLESIPARVPYLTADPERVVRWRERLGSGPGLTVGLAWQGNPDHPDDSTRSVPLARLLPLFDVPGVRWVSLQKGIGAEQIRALSRPVPLVDFTAELDEGCGAFMDTAAVIANLDLVISADTAVAHLAGALGVKTWLALAAVPDWRWLLDRTDSPWYPTMRLFRQARAGDWDSVAAAMADALAELAKDVSVAEAEPPAAAPRVPAAEIAVPISPGELIDKITILQIKQERIADAGKRRHVEEELHALAAVRDRAIPASAELEALTCELKRVNEALWDIEDAIRDCERCQDFGPKFVELARSVYRSNDRRSELKRAMNNLLGSALVEEKSYQPY
jgi:tetratricopeptide (TPR) repeat protein